MPWYSLVRVILIVFAVLATPAAAAEFSVQCEGGKPLKPYFATFDTDSKRVVFETPPTDVSTYAGSNIFVGDIDSSSNQSGREIDFTLGLARGKLSLIFDTDKKTMIWPGLDKELRPRLEHRCMTIPPRSILSFGSPIQITHPVTVRCADTSYEYFTMDVDSKRAIFDRGDQGRLFEGEVTSAGNDQTDMLFHFGALATRAVWNPVSKTVTLESIDGKNPSTTMQCAEVAQRTMIEYYNIVRRR